MIFQVLLFKECGQWVAQGLQMDIVAQSSSVEGAIEAFIPTFINHLVLCEEMGQVIFKGDVLPAPDIYWKQAMKAIAHSERNIGAEMRNRQMSFSFKFYLLQKS